MPSSTPFHHLLLSTTSQTPLPSRYPHPSSPHLLIPPLLHTSLHSALDHEQVAQSFDLSSRPGWAFIPKLSDLTDSPADAPIGEDRDDQEVTIKFYLVSPRSHSISSDEVIKAQSSQILTALSLLLPHKPWRHIDTFLIGWLGIDYIGERVSTEQPGCGSMKLASKLAAEQERAAASKLETGVTGVDDKKRGELVKLWQVLPSLLPTSILKIGTLSLPLSLLQLLSTVSNLPNTSSDPTQPRTSSSAATSLPDRKVDNVPVVPSTTKATVVDVSTETSSEHCSPADKQMLLEFQHSVDLKVVQNGAEQHLSSRVPAIPAVNRLNTPDCHSLPKELTRWANERGVELWAGGGGEGSDPLPSIHLHNTLNEFVSRFPPGVIGSDSKLSQMLDFDDKAPALGVEVEWVLGYTVISRSRNILQDKGYMVAAKLL